MNINKNSYIFTFAAILVIVVGAALAIASEALKPMQQQNIKAEKMQSILATAGIVVERTEAEEAFNKYISDQLILDSEGEVVENSEYVAFEVDVVNEYKSLEADARHYPLFVFNDGNEKKYIIPMAGKGLWGPIWGYVALDEDLNTIGGTSFAHKGETPGLGAEIAEPAFQDQFVGKKIFDEQNEFVSVRVVKGGIIPDGGDVYHAVHGISGGTITSNGVDEMLDRTLNVYIPFLKKNQQNNI